MDTPHHVKPPYYWDSWNLFQDLTHAKKEHCIFEYYPYSPDSYVHIINYNIFH